MAFTETVTDFLDVDEFADEATIGTSTVNGIYDRQYIEVNGVDSLTPTFYCALSDVSSVVQGDSVAVNSLSFTVADVQREEPFCLLVLHNA